MVKRKRTNISTQNLNSELREYIVAKKHAAKWKRSRSHLINKEYTIKYGFGRPSGIGWVRVGTEVRKTGTRCTWLREYIICEEKNYVRI